MAAIIQHRDQDAFKAAILDLDTANIFAAHHLMVGSETPNYATSTLDNPQNVRLSALEISLLRVKLERGRRSYGTFTWGHPV